MPKKLNKFNEVFGVLGFSGGYNSIYFLDVALFITINAYFHVLYYIINTRDTKDTKDNVEI